MLLASLTQYDVQGYVARVQLGLVSVQKRTN